MLKHPGHFTSMKKELGACTKRLSLCFDASTEGSGFSRSTSYGDWVGLVHRAGVVSTRRLRKRPCCFRPPAERSPPSPGAQPAPAECSSGF